MKHLFTLLFLLVFSSATFSQTYEGVEMTSKEQFKYGKFQVLMKADWGSGLINAFFMYHDDSWQNGTYWREIDWEVLGRDTDHPTHALHYGNGNGQNNSIHQQRYIMDLGGDVANALNQDYYWYTIEWTPTRITRMIHTKNWSSTVYYHSIRTWDVGVMDGGQWRANNVGQWNAETMTARFNFWAFNEPGWSGSVDTGRIGTAKMRLDKFVYSEYVSENAQGHGTFTWKWEDNFNSFNSSRWDRSASHTLGDTKLDDENLTFSGGKAIFHIRWNNNNNRVATTSSPVSDLVKDTRASLSVYPNPTASINQLMIQVDLPTTKNVSYAIHDLSGKVVFQGTSTQLAAGSHQLGISTHEVPSLSKGIYLLKVKIGQEVKTEKITINQ